MESLNRQVYRVCRMSLIGLLFTLPVSGQPKPIYSFQKVTEADFHPQSPLVNESADAVVLADVGSVEFEGNSKGWFTYVFKRQKRILIRKLPAMELATIRIGLYRDNDGQEKLDKISAVSYTPEGEKVIESRLQGKDIYEEKLDANHLIKKFTIPGVKEGSIVEYSYLIRSEFLFNLPSWDFQNEYGPTLWSEYYVELPGLLGYMSVQQGYHPFVLNRSSEGSRSYNIRRRTEGAYVGSDESITVTTVTAQHRWAMRDVPGLKGEKYMYASSNFVDRISLQLFQTYDGQDYHDVSPNWTHIASRLTKNPDFGEQINGQSAWAEDILRQVVEENASDTASARKIYQWVQSSFTSTGRQGIFIKNSLREVVKKKSGSAAELNLLLIALLRQRFIEAYPVLLSTRSFGRNNPNYPLMEKLDHVICRVDAGNQSVFLDVSDKHLPYGKLPLECYNGHARVIRADTAIAVSFSPDSVVESASSEVWLSMDSSGFTGRYTRHKGFYESLKDPLSPRAGTNEYIQSALHVSLPEEMEVVSIQSDSAHLLQFDFRLPSFGGKEVIYFNPLFLDQKPANPFAASAREYPVELPYREESALVFTMEVPDGYVVEELPASVKFRLSGNGGYFEYRTSVSGGILNLRRMLVMNKAVFSAQEYDMLRSFYAEVLKKDSEQIVFRKKK